MKKAILLKFFALLVFSVFGLTACFNGVTEECPVEVKISSNPMWPNAKSSMLSIISIADNVTILGVTANRGNAIVNLHGKIPCELKFGQSLSYIHVHEHMSNIIEVAVQTDKGDWILTFK